MKKSFLIMSMLLTMMLGKSVAQNPIVQTCFTTDPAPMVSGDKLYVFTGHDEDGADFFWMNEWRLFSTSDMVNWQDLGCPLAQCDFKWADDRAWAAQCIERDGKFYFYVCIHSKISHGMAIGVAVAERIEGPYHDAIGKPLFENGNWDHIDPTVWIDSVTDKAGKTQLQAYIGWGNPRFYSARLSDDMIHLASEVKCDSTIHRYIEGPWLMHQRSLSKGEIKAMGLSKKDIKASAWGKYFLVYAAGGIPECIAYSESDSPQGPWQYVGEVMAQTNFTNSFTNHAGIVNFKGHDYFFYHTGWLPKGGGFGRSVSVEEFQWQKDGRLPLIQPTKEGVSPVGSLNPYSIIEAETMAFSMGVKTEWNKKQNRIWVSDIHNGDWLKLREVDFSANTLQGGATQLSLSAASALQGGEIEMHLDSINGPSLCTVQITPTGGWEEWQQFSAPIDNLPVGKHDIFFQFKGLKGCKLFNLDNWNISKR